MIYQRAIRSALCQHRGGHHPIAGHAMGHPLGAADGGGHGCRQFGGLGVAHPQPVACTSDRANVMSVCQQLAASVAQLTVSSTGLLRLVKAQLPGNGAPVAIGPADWEAGSPRSNSAQRSSLASSWVTAATDRAEHPGNRHSSRPCPAVWAGVADGLGAQQRGSLRATACTGCPAGRYPAAARGGRTGRSQPASGALERTAQCSSACAATRICWVWSWVRP